MNSLKFLLACAAAVVGVAGCGESAAKIPPKYKVTGTVMLDGRPLESGHIAFRGSDQPPIGGPITNGAYECQAFAGSMVVEIRAFREINSTMPPIPGMPPPEPQQENYLPAKYNTASTLQADVTPTGPNTFDFTLTRR